MLNAKEILILLITTLVLTLAASFMSGFGIFLYIFLAVFGILIINILAKKIAGFYLDSGVEIGLWEIKRYGFRADSYFKRPFPAGIIFPIVISLVSLGNLIWMASLVFDVKPKVYRAAKRHGLYSYSEMTEYHIGIIAAAGIVATLFFSFIGYILGYSEFAKLSIYFAFFNMLPLSDLDGNKIFFGSMALWAFLATIVLIGIGYAFFLV